MKIWYKTHASFALDAAILASHFNRIIILMIMHLMDNGTSWFSVFV